MKLTAKQLSIAADITPDEVQAMHKGYDDVLKETFIDLTHHLSEFGFEKTLYVTFKIEKKMWDEYRNNRQGLGALYGIDLSNFLSRQGILNEYAVPIVSDRSRAKNGFKTIRVEYRLKGKYS
jgi:hypothetical protein